MSNLTILFYSANLKPEPFASNVRAKLLEVVNDPVISITHRPLDGFDTNAVITMPVSTYSVYAQILIGARLATSKFIACAEDDVLYPAEHFQFRPPQDDTFYYSKSRWWVEKDGFYRWRDRTVMSTCICNRELYIAWAERLFEKFPVHPEKREDMTGWAEPSRYEWYLGLPKVKGDTFETENPVVTFNAKPSLGGLRKIGPTDTIRTELPLWGDAKTLWRAYHDHNQLHRPP